MSDDDEPAAIPVDFDAAIDKAFNDAMAQASDGQIRDGFEAWMPPLDPSFQFFGVDRGMPLTPAGRSLYECGILGRPVPPPTLRERIKGAWRGMINGWREG